LVRDELAYVIVSEKTQQAIYWSDICTATDPNSPNFHAEVIHGMTLNPTVGKDVGSALIFPTFGQDYIVPVIKKSILSCLTS
jgi:hypothetical protein